MSIASVHVLLDTFFSAVGMGLFFLMLVPSMILGVKLHTGNGRAAYLLLCGLTAALGLWGLGAALMEPKPSYGTFAVGLVGLPLAFGWPAGWLLGRFVKLGLNDPEPAKTA
jgi:hypothetical protein